MSAVHAQLGMGAAELLRAPSRLRKLSLFAAELGDEGACAVAERLAAGSLVALMELELSCARIGTRGIRRLFATLEAQAAPALEVCRPLGCCRMSPSLGHTPQAACAPPWTLLHVDCKGVHRLWWGRSKHPNDLHAQMLVIGGNPALEEDAFEGRVEALWAARPDLDVAWRSGDAASFQQLGGAPAVDLNVDE
jgi:hypothetical protein